jgi:hypothetical protein
VNVILPFDKNATDGLLRVLISTLSCDMMTGLNPETLLARENKEREDADEKTNHLVVIGASHLKRTVPHLCRLRYEVTDVTAPGRTASVATLDDSPNQLRDTSVPTNAVVIIDLFGTSGSRWEQEDGTLATTVRIGGMYHLSQVVVINIALPIF